MPGRLIGYCDDGAGRIIPPLVLALLARVSRALRPQGRVLGGISHA